VKSRRGLCACIALFLFGDGSAAAQDDDAALLDRFVSELGAEDLSLYGDNHTALLALAAVEAGEMIRAREFAENLLSENPESIEGHCILGLVMGVAEGNLSASAHYLERGLDLFEARYGTRSADTPLFWHWMALGNLAMVLGDLGRGGEAIEVASELEDIYGEDSRYHTAWVHYRARDYDEARRQAVGIISDAEDPEGRVSGWNVLCSVEGDEGNLVAMYEACNAAVESDALDGDVDPVFLSNAAESALALLYAAEAEERLLEATKYFREGTVAIPWTDLMLLYTAQARLPEAVDALRAAQRWRRRQLPYIGALNGALQDLSAAHLLLIAGRADVAARLSRRALERSDRYGRISTAQDERDGWANLFDRAAHRTLAEAYAEEASWSGWREALVARAKELGHRFNAWRAGRRFVANFAERRLLESRLLPHAPGRVPMPEWLELDQVELLGSGAVEVALRRLDARPPPDAVEAYTQAFYAECARVDGRDLESLERSMIALQGLPRWEALLRARVAAGAGASALAQGRAEEAAPFFDLAWQTDPAVIRRLGMALPARFAASGGPAASEALELIRASPRFEPAANGFEVRVEQRGDSLIGCLHGPHGEVLRCADVRPGARSAIDQDPLPMQLARAFHEQAFAPRADLTQVDIRSLDGSSVVSGGGDARVRSVLDELLGSSEQAGSER